jgi:leader peptidase (prepilin peptidase) / N-methyltransferase
LVNEWLQFFADLPSQYWATVFFVLGALLGSFANVIIYRLPQGESVIKPRSHCRQCKKPVAWFDNIPILSYFILRGKCRYCGAKYSWRYPLVELIMGAVFCTVYLYYGITPTTIELLIFSFGLVTVTFIDFDHMILPDVFTLSGIVIGLVGALLNPDRQWWPAFLGVLIGGGFLWAISAIYFALRKIEGMGGGDIKLLAWIGAVLGWQAIPFVILTASLSGTLVGVLVMLKSRGNMQTAIPFGPYLALGAFFFIFGGQEIAAKYISFFIPSFAP